MAQRLGGVAGVGMAIGVIENGRTSIYTAGSTGNGSPLDEHTLFEIGSVTKTFTATILASMVQDGSVKLDDPVAKYLPADVHVPSLDGKKIDLLDLATHHSGLPRIPTNMDFADPDDPYADYTMEEMYAFLDSYRLPRDPGKSFEYSNLGLGLLGDALAARAGVPFAQMLQARVLDPLDMTETGILLTASETGRFAVGHDGDGNPVKPWTFQAMAPAGAIRSTVADMLKYVRCNMGQGPLAHTCLFAQEPRSTFAGNQIGLVWWTGDVTSIVHHGGDTGGYHASVAISPDHTVGVVILTNGGLPVDDLAVHIIDRALPVAQWPSVAHLDDATLDSYVGAYDFKSIGGALIVTRSGDGLLARLTGQDAVHIYPQAKDKFYYRVVDAQLEFARDSSGGITSVALRQDGGTITGPRLSDKAAAAAALATAAPTPSPTAVTLSQSDLDEYAGTYVAASDLVFTVTREGDHLLVQLTGQATAPVYPSGADWFFSKIVDAQFEFKRDAQAKVTALELHQNGGVLLATRSAGPLPAPTFPPQITLDTAALDQYVGTYIASPGAAFTVTRNGDQLMVQLTGQAFEPVYPWATDQFFYKVVDAQISFVRDASGKVTQLVLHQNGHDLPAVRT